MRPRGEGSHARAGREGEGGDQGPLSGLLHSANAPEHATLENPPLDKTPLEPDDETLARRAAEGDESAFEALVGRFQGRVYRLARRLTGADGDAQDVLQETFLQAYRNLAGFRGEAKFSTWLYRIATNAALMQNRARARRPAEPLDAYAPSFDDAGRHAHEPADLSLAARADELLDRRRLVAQALEGIDRLPESCRAAFVLRDLEEMPTAEVAAVLGIEPAAVRQRVHRARLLLRGFLSHLVGVEP